MALLELVNGKGDTAASYTLFLFHSIIYFLLAMSDSLFSLISAVDRADSATALTDAVQALADACLPGAIPTLVEALNYNNPGAAVAAVDGLVNLGEPAVPGLLEQLDSNNYTARSWAIRALAGIGDPRGLVTLLGAATADFSMSVRRAAARGLGSMKWYCFPSHLLEVAQAEALESLLFVARQDEEWVVRYAAVVGLEALALALTSQNAPGRAEIEAQFAQMTAEEASPSVRARVWKAQQQLQEMTHHRTETAGSDYSPLSATDWEQILEKLYQRKLAERETLPEGDPRNYR
ncbi:MAG: HEAT repeat domain-containing protein, partial [Cyanobacteria bacterium J06636_16]